MFRLVHFWFNIGAEDHALFRMINLQCMFNHLAGS
jgi:hypothetical protein